MDRLTERRQSGGVAARRSEYGVCCSNYCNNCPKGTSECEELKAMIDRLAAYEDIGLEPKQVRKIANVLQEVGQEYNCRFEFVAEVVEKYAKYVDAERDGRCVVLPCKVGTNVAVIDSAANTIEICQVLGYEQYGSGKPEISVQNAPKHQEWYTLDCFGKTVFLTRAEAEAALAKEEETP